MRTKVRFFKILLFCLTTTAPDATAAPSQFLAEVTTSYSNGRQLDPSLKTLGRVINFRLNQIDPYPGSRSRFYSGKSRKNSKAKSGAALDISKDGARLIYLRRGRAVVVAFPIVKNQTRILGQSSLSPSFAKFGCGNSSQYFSNKKLVPDTLKETPGLLLEIAAEADYEFFSMFGDQTGDEIQAIINAASAVYLEQLNLNLRLVAQDQWESAITQPYSGTSAFTLLEQFQNYTILNQQLGQADLYHLFTGKRLQSNIAGLAYQGSVCEAGDPFSYGLSAYVSDFALQAVIASHEIGHSLGAAHDDSGVSLMNSVVAASKNKFSAISLAEIESYLSMDLSCFQDKTDLQIGLSQINLKNSKGLTGFQTIIKPSGGYKGCRIRIYGSANRRIISNSKDFSEDGIKLILRSRLFPRQNLSGKPVSSYVKSGRGQMAKGYLKAYLTCPDGRTASSKTREIRTFSDRVKSSLDRFFDRLARKI